MNNTEKDFFLPRFPLARDENTGWPWTIESAPISETMPNGSPWPRVSIVTPSYNQGWALEETIRSVLLQGYPNLEYIVMDGGSTDGSLEIIKKYEPWITYWQSKSDGGQSQALNAGFRRATGDVLGWMNSDDIFLPNGIETLMLLRAEHPACVGWVGAAQEIDRDGGLLRRLTPTCGEKLSMLKWGTCGGEYTHFYQPACLFSAEAFREVGALDEFMWCGMDLDLWIRLRDIGDFALLDEVVASPRIYPGTKSGTFDVRPFVDMVAMCYKLGSHQLAAEELKHYEEALHLIFVRNLTVSDAMRGISNDQFLNHISVGELLGYLLRRVKKRIWKA